MSRYEYTVSRARQAIADKWGTVTRADHVQRYAAVVDDVWRWLGPVGAEDMDAADRITTRVLDELRNTTTKTYAVQFVVTLRTRTYEGSHGLPTVLVEAFSREEAENKVGDIVLHLPKRTTFTITEV